MSAVAAPPSPYKGLAPFEDSDHDALFFFGREREIEVIAANLMAARLTVLYGVSGVGKTSLLRAGVAHRLRGAHDAAIVVFSTWTGDPVEGLLDALDAAVPGGVVPVSRSGSLADVLAAWTRRLDSDLYVVLDQFEEYFLYREDERGPGTLADELPEALRRRGLRVNFLIGIREDSLARLDVFKARIPNLFANSLRLDRLDRIAGRTAILGPLERYNELAPEHAVAAEPELVEAVLQQVAVGRVDLGQSGRGGLGEQDDQDRIEAPYLQLVLERLWEVEAASESRRLRLETLERLGGAVQIVEDHLDRAMSELSPEEKDAAAAIYNHLVTPSGTKIAHRARDLAGYAAVDEAETEHVLNRLVEERIVRAGEDGAEGPRFEIFHDVLAEAVLAWRTRHEAERLLVAERKASARRHRRMLTIAAAGAVVIAALTAIAVFALAQRHDARSQARRARGRELAALAGTLLPTDPERSVRLALAATKYERSGAIEDVLRTSLRNLRVKAVLPAGGRPVSDVDFSPDGKQLVTAGEDGRARIYRSSDGRRLRSLDDGGALAAASFSPDGRKIVTAGADGVARIWNTRTGRLLHALRQGAAATGATFSRDSTKLVTTGTNNTVALWDVPSGHLLHRLPLPNAARAASFSGDGTLLVVTLVPAARDRSARIFDVASGSLVESLNHGARLTTATFAPTGPLVVTGGVDRVARVWDARAGLQFHEPVIRPVAELKGHSGQITAAEFSPSDRFIVTASTDETARVWRTATGTLEGVLTSHRNFVGRAVFSPDGETVATASTDRVARIFLPNGTLRVSLVGHRESVTDVDFSRDGESVATASADGTARLWDRRPQPDLELIGRQGARVAAVAFTGDGRRIVSAGRDGSIRVWRVGRARPPVAAFQSSVRPTAVALSSDGRRAATNVGRDVVVRGAATADVLSRVRNTGAAAYLALSRDGELLAVVGRDRSVRVWRVDRGRPVRTIVGPGSTVAAVAFSADARRLVTAALDPPVARVWDVRTGKPVTPPLVGHHNKLTSAAFSPNGRYVATSSRDRDARVWDARTGRLVSTLRGHYAIVSGVAFSADSRWVVTAGPGTAGIWDPVTGHQLFGVNGRDRVLSAVAFAPNGWRIATGGENRTVKTYDCRLCGDVDVLIAVARERLASLRR